VLHRAKCFWVIPVFHKPHFSYNRNHIFSHLMKDIRKNDELQNILSADEMFKSALLGLCACKQSYLPSQPALAIS